MDEYSIQKVNKITDGFILVLVLFMLIVGDLNLCHFFFYCIVIVRVFSHQRQFPHSFFFFFFEGGKSNTASK